MRKRGATCIDQGSNRLGRVAYRALARVVVAVAAVAALAAGGCAAAGDSSVQPTAPEGTPEVAMPGGQCRPFTPEELPSGAEPGEARPHPEDEPRESFRTWGEGRDQVVVGWGAELKETGADFELSDDWPAELVVTKDGVERHVVRIGDGHHSEVAIRFVMNDCPYTLWMVGVEFDEDDEIFVGFTDVEAVEYARRF